MLAREMFLALQSRGIDRKRLQRALDQPGWGKLPLAFEVLTVLEQVSATWGQYELSAGSDPDWTVDDKIRSIAQEHLGDCIRSKEGEWCDAHNETMLRTETTCELMRKVFTALRTVAVRRCEWTWICLPS